MTRCDVKIVFGARFHTCPLKDLLPFWVMLRQHRSYLSLSDKHSNSWIKSTAISSDIACIFIIGSCSGGGVVGDPAVSFLIKAAGILTFWAVLMLWIIFSWWRMIKYSPYVLVHTINIANIIRYCLPVIARPTLHPSFGQLTFAPITYYLSLSFLSCCKVFQSCKHTCIDHVILSQCLIFGHISCKQFLVHFTMFFQLLFLMLCESCLHVYGKYSDACMSCPELYRILPFQQSRPQHSSSQEWNVRSHLHVFFQLYILRISKAHCVKYFVAFILNINSYSKNSFKNHQVNSNSGELTLGSTCWRTSCIFYECLLWQCHLTFKVILMSLVWDQGPKHIHIFYLYLQLDHLKHFSFSFSLF